MPVILNYSMHIRVLVLHYILMIKIIMCIIGKNYHITINISNLSTFINLPTNRSKKIYTARRIANFIYVSLISKNLMNERKW